MRLRLGTRGSELARLQAGMVAKLAIATGHDVEMVTVVTEGDLRTADTPWGEGVFVGALENALRRGEIDLAVHSAKDVPIEPEDDLTIAAYLLRVDARDALVTRDGTTRLGDLPHGAMVGTDSPRRSGFLRAARPDLRIVPLHGNVDTRLRRLDAREVDALVLAVAGLQRLGRSDRIAVRFDPEIMAPAPGQGALAVQVRAADGAARRVVSALDDRSTRCAVELERTVLEIAGGGCRAPLGALAQLDGTRLRALASAAAPDGSWMAVHRWEGAAEAAFVGAAYLAGALIASGYRKVVPAPSAPVA